MRAVSLACKDGDPSVPRQNRETSMRPIVRNHAAFAFALLLGACSGSTAVTNSWKDPTVPVRKYQKVLAVFITKDGTIRRTAEDQMARRIPNAVASYTVLPEEALQDQAKAKEGVKKNGFDGAVLVRPGVGDTETSFDPVSGHHDRPT